MGKRSGDRALPLMMNVDLPRCVAGDSMAWDRFVTETAPVVYAAVRRTMRRHGAAEQGEVDDAVQDVYLKLFRRERRLLASYDPARAALSTWLTLVARSVTVDRLRRRRPAGDLEGVPEPAAGPPPAASSPELPLHLLTGRQRLVLSLLFDADLSVAEAAATMGVDVQTVRSTKHKALSRLREALAAAPPSGNDGD